MSAMSRPTFQGPQLGIKTFRGSPTNWQSRGLSPTSRVLTLAMGDEQPFFPSTVENTTWQHLIPGDTTLSSKDAEYDAVYLTNILDRLSTEAQKKLVAEAMRATKNGGRVVAYSPSCDDAQEARDLASQYGMDVTEFDARRLSNMDIVRLRPHEAMFFLSRVVVPNRHRLVGVLNELGVPATLEHMWEIHSGFAIRRFHVGMAWMVQRV